MTTNGNSALERLLQTRKPQEPEITVEEPEMEDDAPDEKAYAAFGKARGGRRGELGFKLYYQGGEIEVLYYTYLIRAHMVTPDELALMCTDGIYTLTGNDLRPLLSLLREHKITFLQAFNPAKHLPRTASNDEMVITSITLQSPDTWWEQHERRQAIRGSTR